MRLSSRSEKNHNKFIKSSDFNIGLAFTALLLSVAYTKSAVTKDTPSKNLSVEEFPISTQPNPNKIDMELGQNLILTDFEKQLPETGLDQIALLSKNIRGLLFSCKGDGKLISSSESSSSNSETIVHIDCIKPKNTKCNVGFRIKQEDTTSEMTIAVSCGPEIIEKSTIVTSEQWDFQFLASSVSTLCLDKTTPEAIFVAPCLQETISLATPHERKVHTLTQYMPSSELTLLPTDDVFLTYASSIDPATRRSLAKILRIADINPSEVTFTDNTNPQLEEEN